MTLNQSLRGKLAGSGDSARSCAGALRAPQHLAMAPARPGWMKLAFTCLAVATTALAHATLPPPSPAKAQEAAAKKAQADAQAAKDKQELLASMDSITARWRSRAASQGLRANPAVPVAAPGPAVTAPATGAAPAGQPGGQQGPAVQAMPIRSEKLGTAPPSADVKKKP
jgi:colicin import membrane protein